MRTARRLALVGALVLLAACTTLYEGRYDFRDGWRKGEVIRIESADKVPQNVRQRCQVPDSASAAASASMAAIVKYRNFNRVRNVAVPVQAGQSGVGDAVLFNAEDRCSVVRSGAGTP